VIERGPQSAVVLILERHEAEGLKHTIRSPLCGTEDFGHSMHWPGLRLEGNFDEVSLCQTLSQL
jgi:hypothetical protein